LQQAGDYTTRNFNHFRDGTIDQQMLHVAGQHVDWFTLSGWPGLKVSSPCTILFAGA
jgi:hypothetical protein